MDDLTPHPVIQQRGWITSCGDLWNCKATYCLVPYSWLPKFDHIDDKFSWMGDVSDEFCEATQFNRLQFEDDEDTGFDRVLEQVEAIGLQLPQPFIDYMQNTILPDYTGTNTLCYLEFSDELVPVPGAEGEFLLRFLNDSQGCVAWYLWLQPGDDCKVIGTYTYLERDLFDALNSDQELQDYEQAFRDSWICADSFLEFIHRFWIENAIWFYQDGDLPLFPRLSDYLSKVTNKLD